MKFIYLVMTAGVLTMAVGTAARAQDMQDYAEPGFYGAVGYGNVSPKSSTGTLLGVFNSSVNNDAEPTLTLGYRFPQGLGLEVWTPINRFQHDLSLGGTRAASFEDRPLLLTVQYHFLQDGAVQPFVGLGYGRVKVSDEHIVGPNGPVSGGDLDIENNDGLVGQVGVDVFVTPRLFVRADARYFQWKSDVSVEGVGIGQLEVNPWIYGISLGFGF